MFRVATSIFILLYITSLMTNVKLLVPNMFSVLIFKHVFSNLPLDYSLYFLSNGIGYDDLVFCRVYRNIFDVSLDARHMTSLFSFPLNGIFVRCRRNTVKRTYCTDIKKIHIFIRAVSFQFFETKTTIVQLCLTAKRMLALR